MAVSNRSVDLHAMDAVYNTSSHSATPTPEGATAQPSHCSRAPIVA